MKKTYVTSMPNHIGAFLKASRCFAELGINITRVSYNKAIDSHILFIDAEGTEEQLKMADVELGKIGYLEDEKHDTSIVLLEFCLKDVPGSVTDILSLINEFNFNISYISSQENGTDYQFFKMGLYVEDPDRLTAFLERAGEICKVRVIEYNGSEKFFDNSIFYSTYVKSLASMMKLSEEVRQELLVYVNLAMQTLDEQGLSPYKTFDSISKFAELLSISQDDNFNPRITTHKITDNTEITVIEPPCGSNVIIIKSQGKVLFIDSGYACYDLEMGKLLRELVSDFDNIKKEVLITHADLDHCGLLPMFDKVIASYKTAWSITREYNGKSGFREKNPLHKPYLLICKALTSYVPVNPEKITVPWENCEDMAEPLTRIGDFDFEELHFEVYEGKGGHVPGEIVLVDRAHKIAFTGDIYINIRELTREQAEYNKYAPILMTSVDTDPALCAEERKAIFDCLGYGEWKVFGAHGPKKDYVSLPE